MRDLSEGKIKQKAAASQLGLSVRQVKRKLKDYRRAGPTSLAHGLRGKPSNNQLEPGLRDRALGVVSERYPDFGPTLAAEKLAELHDIHINPETLRAAMTEVGLWRPKHRPVNVHVWRERKDFVGELVQGDGSPHAWFEDRAPKCTLLAFIDDATSRILWLEFALSESTDSLMQATWQYLETHGRPVALYFDRGGVYKVNLGNPDDERITQYARALDELDIRLIHARSPQAKGRVERLFHTLQNRLVKELRLADISTISEANRFVRDVYIPRHNAKFAVEPKQPTDLHRSPKGYDLNHILCLKNPRLLTSDFTLRYRSRWLQLDAKQPTRISPKDHLMVYEHLNKELSVWIRSTKLNFQIIPKPAAKSTLNMATRPPKSKGHTPPTDHPWRKFTIKQKVTF
jgi:hypothetical protein